MKNDQLKNLHGLAHLSSVGGELIIGANERLESLAGLSKLTSVGKGLVVKGNPYLTSLEGPSALTALGNKLVVHYNRSLPSCQVCALLKRLTSPPASVEIAKNKVDTCNNECP